MKQSDEDSFHTITFTARSGKKVTAKRVMMDSGATYSEISYELAKKLGCYAGDRCASPEISVTSLGEYEVCSDNFAVTYRNMTELTTIRYPYDRPDQSWGIDGVLGRQTLQAMGISIVPE